MKPLTAARQFIARFVTRRAARQFIARFVTRREEGATLAEYGLLLALIAVVCVTAIAALGSRISTMFQSISTSI
jgi:pilus assembly protein Flp/PilA